VSRSAPIWRAALLALALFLLVAPGASAHPKFPRPGALPSEYVLPGNTVFPEGVTTRPGSDEFFVSSTTDGTIFRGTLDDATTEVFLPPGGDGRVNAVGLRASRHRLVVAGGATGLIFVYDIRSGRLLRRFSTGSGAAINDVAIAPDGDAYVTDSQRGLLFHIPARLLKRPSDETTALQPFVDFKPTPVGSYSNGVVPVGNRYLLVGGLISGVIARVDRRTKEVRAVDLGDETVPVPDGLARRGRTVYVVNLARRVTELKLSHRWLRARVVRHITSPRFRLPTTVAIAGRRLLVVNSQFDRRGGSPVLPFTVSAVPRP
jgi:sugar lactone lactonase YvrE